MTENLFSILDSLQIDYQTTEHPPLFTAEDSVEWERKIPGLMCKSLFLKDKKGTLWLAVMPAHKRASLKGIENTLNVARLSFCQPELLLEILG